MTTSNVELVVQYILEHRGSGHFLPYNDYAIVREWMAKAKGPEQLLLLLSDVLPDYYQRPQVTQAPRVPRSLSGLRHKVLKKLEH